MDAWYRGYLTRNYGPLFAGELAPCPFCGGKAEQGGCTGEDAQGREGSAVGCARCRCHGPFRTTNVGAAKAWNRRTNGAA